jgi:hypothetical protein
MLLSKIMAEHFDMPEPQGYGGNRVRLTGHAKLGGKSICMFFFAAIMDAGYSQVKDVFHHCTAVGALNYVDVREVRKERSGNSAEDISFWLTETAKLHDPMPNRPWIRLYFSSKRQLFEAYEADRMQLVANRWGDYNLPIVSYNWFMRIWRERHGEMIRIRGTASMFAVCSTCLTLRQSMAISHLGKEDREQMNHDYAEHRKHIDGERRAYEANKRLAVLEKNDNLSIALDGADQGACGLPYFRQPTKFSGTIEKMKQVV